MSALTSLERDVMELFLAGDVPNLEILRRQARLATATSRETSIHGFYTRFGLEADVLRFAEKSLVLSDVLAEVPGLSAPVGFVLFIEDGCIVMLEGYTIADEWPATMDHARLYYEHGLDEHVETLRAKLQ